jgi:hypothetical protein
VPREATSRARCALGFVMLATPHRFACQPRNDRQVSARGVGTSRDEVSHGHVDAHHVPLTLDENRSVGDLATIRQLAWPVPAVTPCYFFRH